MKYYRCTRTSPYPPRSAGYLDHTAREGHYLKATSTEDALRQMRELFPDDPYGFTAKLAKKADREEEKRRSTS